MAPLRQLLDHRDLEFFSVPLSLILSHCARR
jgi:hypothetical protein